MPGVAPRRGRPNSRVAIVTVLLSQTVMIMLMGITALHMRDHGHALSGISVVFSAHTLGVFGFALLVGRLPIDWAAGP